MATTTTTTTDRFRARPDDWLDVGAGEVAHRRFGTGPDVLFVHGWPLSGATWRRLVPHLQDRLTCHVIDLPGTGDSRFDANTSLSVDQHIVSVRRVVDLLGLDDVALVGHDSGGLIARHAMAGDPRLRALGLVNTEQPQGLSWRFRSFLAQGRLPGFGHVLAWAVNRPRLRRHRMVLGDAFADASHIDGEFAEFFLEPIHRDPVRREATMKVLRSFDTNLVHQLADVHGRLDVPVGLVWGATDPFFPRAWAEEMVHTFPRATLDVIDDAGLLAHEEAPRQVASALLPTLLPTPIPTMGT